MNIIFSWTVLKFVLDSFKDFLNMMCCLTVLSFVLDINFKDFSFLEHNMFLNCSYICSWLFQTFLEYYVFLNCSYICPCLFQRLNSFKHNVFLNCSYICSWLFRRQSINIIKYVLELFLSVFLIISKTYLEYNVSI